MSVQLKYKKKVSLSGATKSTLGRSPAGMGGGDFFPANIFLGQCDYIFDYCALSHQELYQKSNEALLDYIRVEYKEVDVVAKSILRQGAAYPPKPTNPLAGSSWMDEEFCKREVARYVNIRANVDKGLKQAYTLMWGQCSEKLWVKLETSPRFTIMLAVKDAFALDDMI